MPHTVNMNVSLSVQPQLQPARLVALHRTDSRLHRDNTALAVAFANLAQLLCLSSCVVQKPAAIAPPLCAHGWDDAIGEPAACLCLVGLQPGRVMLQRRAPATVLLAPLMRLLHLAQSAGGNSGHEVMVCHTWQDDA